MSLKKSYKALKEYRSNPLLFIKNLHKQQGHRIQLKIFNKKLFILSHPEDVMHVLKSNHGAYSKGRTTKTLRQFLGNGLLTNEGESWRRQHRLSRPAMGLKSVYVLAPRMFDTTFEYIHQLFNKSEVDILAEMNKLTWRIVLQTLFSQKPTAEMDVWLNDVLVMMNLVTKKTRTALPMPFWVPTPEHLAIKRILNRFDEYIYGLIAERRRSKHEAKDFLQLLIDASEEGTKGMTDREIRDEVITFLMAGHETVTNSMSWTLIEIAKNPQYKDVLREEASFFFTNWNYEALNDSPWITAVIDEAMRLWPPVWVFMRQAQKDDKIGDLLIPRKTNVVVAPYLTHHSSDFWENPEVFYPERFLASERKKHVSGAFYPFGLGPRACIGASFAGMETKIILATLIHHFDWEIVEPKIQQTEAGITLRPKNNTLVKLKRMR